MKLADLPYGQVRNLELRRPGAEPFAEAPPPGAEGALRRIDSGDTVLALGRKVYVVEGAAPADAQGLADLVNQNLPRLLCLTAAAPAKAPTRLFLKAHQFPLARNWPARMDVGVPEAVLDHVARNYSIPPAVVGQVRREFGPQYVPERKGPQDRKEEFADRVMAWLADKLLLPGASDGAPVRCFLSAGGGRAADDARAFRLHGTTLHADVERGEDGRLMVTRVTQASGRSGPLILLVEAPLFFCPAGRAGAMAGEARTFLDQIVARRTSYLGVWGEYEELERAVKIEEAVELGSFAYDQWSWQKDKDGAVVAEFRLRENTEEVRQQLRVLQGAREIALEADTEVPEELRPRPEPAGGAGAAPAPPPPAAPPRGRKAGPKPPRPFNGRGDRKGVLVDQCVIQLKPTDSGRRAPKPPPQGFLYPSLFAYNVSRARRKRAFEKIRSGSCPMPQLGLIVEGQMDLLSPPSWPGVRASALGGAGKLTEVQQQALRIALNTPDIALIQGPPGTGKTTVIAALMRCLSAMADRSTGLRGLVLLTSFQHDAVENAAGKGLVNGLPVMKVGGRRRGSDQPVAVDKSARDWAEARINNLKARLKKTPAQEAYLKVQQLVLSYVLRPGTPRQTAATLRLVRDHVRAPDRASADLVPLALRERLDRWIQTLEGDAPPEDAVAADPQTAARRAVRALRCDPASFADDGAVRARKALVRLKGAGRQDLLGDADRDLLTAAAEWRAAEPPPFLAELADLRERLLSELTPESLPTTADLPQLKVQQLLDDVLKALEARTRQSADGPAALLAEYLHDLENDHAGVKEALLHYTPVLATTCQQADSKQVADVKGSELVYDTVIVDEAARANPLDLFIPMAMARRRIILVGDHRQLPHSLEQKLQRQIDESGSVETREILARSLFERLFTSLQAREEVDPIPRTITLNTQFRMHRVLGDFVSAQFYEKHDPKAKVETGSPDEEKSHTLNGYTDPHTGVGKVAAWIDVPYGAGGETSGDSNSKSRPAEARRIARELTALVRQTDELTFGVITFYSAQVTELMAELQRQLKKALGREAAHELLHPKPGKPERLRVGTVDAFQGKEFDVVFLSMTRSNRLPWGDGKALRRKYGHLMLENRLCVAMSRQKRLLIVAGDAEMLETPRAKDVLSSLVAFHELCETHGLLLR